MQAVITQLQAEVQQLQQCQSWPKTVLPDPEKFNGLAYWFDTWLPLIQAKLRVDSLAIGDSIAQFYYMYLNLKSNVQATVLLQLVYTWTQQHMGLWLGNPYNSWLGYMTIQTRCRRQKISFWGINRGQTQSWHTLQSLNVVPVQGKQQWTGQISIKSLFSGIVLVLWSQINSISNLTFYKGTLISFKSSNS